MPLSEIPDVVSVGLPTTHRDNTFEHLPKEEEGATSEQIGKILWRILEGPSTYVEFGEFDQHR